MSVLTRPRSALIDTAIEYARGWCSGHFIDGAPALAHAIKVARKAEEHEPGIRPELAAALLLHDAPEYAAQDPAVGSAESLYVLLGVKLNAEVARLVRAITDEHAAMENRALNVARMDHEVLLGIAADKVVAIAAITQRGRSSADPAAFWSTRSAFTGRMSYFHDFAVAARSRLPDSLAVELALVVADACEITAPYRPGRC